MTTTVEQLLAHKPHNVWSVDPEATVEEAVSLFGTHEIGAVLVCNERGLIGVITERDCIRKLLWQGRATLASRVRDVMRSDVSPVAPHDTIEHCMALMNDHRTRHLPVVNHGSVLGVISMGDVIHALLGDRDSLIESLESYISGSPSVRPPAH
ncbi:MAG TPA: CBS domain-containing protein [Polyangiales bacterium]|nr:CBS domain-containing protein [Polyangiales bacterium]